MTDSGIAICYLSKENDEKNKALLSESELRVIFEGRVDYYPLDQLTRVEFKVVKLWAPVVYGGISTPLSVASMATGDFNPWLVLFVFCSGLLSFYYGWIGKNALFVVGKNINSQYKLNSISENLGNFVDYINGYMSKNSFLNYLYIPINKKDIGSDLQSSSSYFRCYTYAQSRSIQLNDDQILAIINPMKVVKGVKYEKNSTSGILEPRIYGPINFDAIIDTIKKPIATRNEGQAVS